MNADCFDLVDDICSVVSKRQVLESAKTFHFSTAYYCGLPKNTVARHIVEGTLKSVRAQRLPAARLYEKQFHIKSRAGNEY
jgi:hypothetical protein